MSLNRKSDRYIDSKDKETKILFINFDNLKDIILLFFDK